MFLSVLLFGLSLGFCHNYVVTRAHRGLKSFEINSRFIYAYPPPPPPSLQHDKLVSFSEQSLVDCSWGYGNNGCDGGESERAYQWIIDNGCIPTEDSYGGGRYLMQVSGCGFTGLGAPF